MRSSTKTYRVGIVTSRDKTISSVGTPRTNGSTRKLSPSWSLLDNAQYFAQRIGINPIFIILKHIHTPFAHVGSSRWWYVFQSQQEMSKEFRSLVSRKKNMKTSVWFSKEQLLYTWQTSLRTNERRQTFSAIVKQVASVDLILSRQHVQFYFWTHGSVSIICRRLGRVIRPAKTAFSMLRWLCYAYTLN